jgi:hypothetical protein
MCEGCYPNTFSTKFEFQINSIFLKKIVMDFMGKASHLQEAFSKFYRERCGNFDQESTKFLKKGGINFNVSWRH